jgi:hypothetical protein
MEFLLQEIAPELKFSSPSFLSNFIQWFAVIYGILLPLILFRVWTQLDVIDREFEREADTVKILYKESLLLKDVYPIYAYAIAASLQKYVLHVLKNNKYEIRMLYNGDKNQEDERTKGDKLLEEIDIKFHKLIGMNNKMNTPKTMYLIPKLVDRLDALTEMRRNRIALASQRLFDSLRIVALITSIIFVVPFYFVSFIPGSGLLDNLLTIGVTLLVIFIYLLIEDFDEPFGGTWRISDESWKRNLAEMKP